MLSSRQFAQRLRQTATGGHPAVDKLISTAVRYYARSRIETARFANSIHYDAPIEPQRLYEIDPNNIEQTLSWTAISADRKADEYPLFTRPKYRLAGRVFDGDWDQETKPLTDSTILQSFRAHFEQNVPWERTRFYAETLNAIKQGAEPWGCDTRDALDTRCAQLDRTFEQLATDGYKSQNTLYERGDPSPSEHQLYRTIWGEIAVNVGRNGELLFQDGHNRLAMARILGLDSIPVVILVRHEQWQQTRDQVDRGDVMPTELPAQIRDHPDLDLPSADPGSDRMRRRGTS